MKDQKAEIKTELKLSLEELTKLSGHDEIKTAWDDLKTVIAKAISIKKINNYRTLISKYGVDWYKEYYKNEGEKDKVNPVRLIANVWGNSDKIGFDCSKKDGNLQEWKDYFKECGMETGIKNDKRARVVRVLKPTARRYEKGWKYYVSVKGMGTSWRDNKELRSELKSKHSKDISSKGKLGELVVETCDHKKSGLGFFSLEGPESIFCKEILQKFFGADVKDKRYCL